VSHDSTSLRDLFLLDPDVHFLNHGSFGATPKPVFEEYQRWQRELERQPVEFLGRRHDDLMREAREHLASFLNVDAASLVFVTNATWGINVIARSIDLEPGDEVLTTDHEYGACTMTWEHLLGKMGACLRRHEVALPVTTHEEFVESFWGAVGPRTKVVYLSHITSPTALIFPIKEICRRARKNGILTVVDGAHAPGQIPLDLTDLGVDIYSGNLHKWLCTPKGSGFLYVRPEEQDWIESLVISWGWGRGGVIAESTYVQRNEWQGTRDISPFLAVPAAIRFQQEHDWPTVRARCHELARQARQRLADLTGLPPIVPDSTDWFAQMIAAHLPTDDPETLKTRLYDEYRVEVPMGKFHDVSRVRVSFQGYNDQSDLDALVEGLQRLL
jgi:isopenicillin-N epimerase